MFFMSEKERERYMSFWEHLEELRWVIFKSLAVIVVFSIVSTMFVNYLFEIFIAPLKVLIAHKTVILNQAGPFDGIFIKMKIGLLCGVILSMPFILIIIWGFISPALGQRERKSFWWIFSSISILFLIGVIGGYYSLFFILPVLLSMGVESADNIWRLNDYVSFLFYWVLSAGAIMELPLVMLVAVRLHFLNVETLKKWRPYAFLSLFIVSAVITADPISLIVLGIILYLLYEAGIFICSFQKRQKSDMVDQEDK